MKTLSKYLIFIFVLTNLVSCGLTKTQEKIPPTYIRNVSNDHSKKINFIKANEWMVNEFNDADSVIMFTDKEAGLVKGKYTIKKNGEDNERGRYGIMGLGQKFFVTITLRVRANETRIEIAPPDKLYSELSAGGTQTGFTKNMFNETSRELSDNFEKHMKESSANDTWKSESSITESPSKELEDQEQ